MKIIYTLVNVFLAAGIIFLTILHFKFRPSPPEKALSQTPVKSKIEIMGVFDRNTPSPVPEVNNICNKNPFDPARSEDGHSEGAGVHASLKQTSMELVGITEFGNTKGAIIIENALQMSNPGRPDARKTSGRHYYKIGDRLPNGYVLQSIGGDSAVLVFGGSTITLKIERNDKSSIERKEAVPSPQPVATATSRPVAITPKNEEPPKVSETEVLEAFKKKYPERYERYMKQLNQNGGKRETALQPLPL